MRSTHHYRGDAPPEFFNLARYCLAKAAHQFPEKIGLIAAASPHGGGDDESWTFAELEKIILTGAQGLLACGINPGDRLLIRLDNTANYAFLFLAATAAGIIPIPASAQLSAREVAYIIEDASPCAIAVDPALAMPDLSSSVKILNLDDVVEILTTGPCGAYANTHNNDPAYLIYTSGTSGRPKGVLHAHRAAWGRRPMYQGWYGISCEDILLHAGAFNWTYTLGTGLFDDLDYAATTIVYTGKRTATVWPHLIAIHRATIFAAVPGVYRQILKYNNDFEKSVSTLRHGLVAGEPLPQNVADDWERKTGTRLYEALGMSEISTYISSSPCTGIKPGSPGKAQDGRSLAIIPETGKPEPLPANQTGLIGVHRTDPGLMLRYWSQDSEFEKSFRGEWFCGGDLGEFDEDGYFWFRGRNDDLMNAQGYRVSPHEVEQAMVQHEGIAEAAVAEVRVGDDLSIVVGFIVTEENHAVSSDDLNVFLSRHLADYKCPRQILTVARLPRSANGKLLRRQLAMLFNQTPQP